MSKTRRFVASCLLHLRARSRSCTKFFYSLIAQSLPTSACSTVTPTMPRFSSNLDGYITARVQPFRARSAPLSISRSRCQPVRDLFASSVLLIRICTLTCFRVYRPTGCPKLVPPWAMLHVATQVPQSIRSVPASRLSRWSQSYVLVFYRRALLPDQSVS